MHAFTLPTQSLAAFLDVFGPRAKAPSPAVQAVDIPQTFSENQARQIYVLKALGADLDAALRILRGKGQAFSCAQLECAAEMFGLDMEAFCLTLAGATQPCTLRGQLSRRRVVQDDKLIALWGDTALRLMQHSRCLLAPPATEL